MVKKIKCWKSKGNLKYLNECKGKEVKVTKSNGTWHTSVATLKNGVYQKVVVIPFENRKGTLKNPVKISGSKIKAKTIANKYMKSHNKC